MKRRTQPITEREFELVRTLLDLLDIQYKSVRRTEEAVHRIEERLAALDLRFNPNGPFNRIMKGLTGKPGEPEL